MDKVTLIHKRMYHDDNHTMGFIIFDNGKINYILEDTKRDIKVAGETRIPAGLYEIKQRKEESRLTMKYRANYEWFQDWHLQLQNVPNFKYVYDHIGNYDTNTDGCRLHGLYPSNPRTGEDDMVKRSQDAFIDYYRYVTKLLESGTKVYTLIVDEDEPQ